MARFYTIQKVSDADGITELKISFGESGQNPEIVRDAVAELGSLNLQGGKLCKVNGPASLPTAMAIAHGIGHLFAAVACFDPKLNPGYVVCITHTPDYTLGQQVS